MLNNLVKNNTAQWLQSQTCSIAGLLKYIRGKGELRDTQVEAIETYLYLKIVGENKPLWQLFAEGLFKKEIDFSPTKLPYPRCASYLMENIAAYSLYSFASEMIDNKMRLPGLVELIQKQPEQLDYEAAIKKLFYDVDYSDYLMSLPMGAGKTYLMAAFIYLDLYYASIEPDNMNFAHNFLVLIPSGLKSSIGPSLRTIESFDPSWVIPQPYAADLKRQLKFDVLDEQKAAQRSNKARNPNAAKVNQCLPDPFGQVFVVNAEKVILNKVRDDTLVLDFSEDEEERSANELRALIGKIPNLSIFIDEVHHAASSDIKLRQVVNGWNEKGNITTVLGFSGTPYLSSVEKVPLIGSHVLKSSEITNTVYYYPLTRAIESFLKNPVVKVAENMSHLEIVRGGIEDFNRQYGDLVYGNGTIAKLAIYCSTIAMLEEEIYPFLQNELKINPDEILRYHGGNQSYSLAAESELEFKSLDTPLSRKKYILLVAIGKEGWDCRSLTAVLLPQKSRSSSRNAIIQTTCRCLRQVVKGQHETALIWLNKENARILNQQLQQEQNTSIEELNRLTRSSQVPMIERVSRVATLELPKIDYYQLQIKYQAVEEEEGANSRAKLDLLLDGLESYKSAALVRQSGIHDLDSARLDFVGKIVADLANYNTWVFNLSRSSFKMISVKELLCYDQLLKRIFDAVTFQSDGFLVFDGQYDLYAIETQIRLAFSVKKHLQTDEEVVPQEADLLIVDKLQPVALNRNIYPPAAVREQILEFDINPRTQAEFDQSKTERIIELIKEGRFEAIAQVAQELIYPIVWRRDKTLHHLPYNFDSGFERTILETALNLGNVMDKNLEMYFNGERGITEFVIDCYAKRGRYWRSVGRYTADFLMLQRKPDRAIHKVLIVETKGEAYASDESFKRKRFFVETEFLQQNEAKFGYKRFDFLYLEDTSDLDTNMARLSEKINEFFED
ncbi:MAG: DEAD/DEAH box helicase family protein [Kiritimatiellae bacterium]|nr:DEAD/DEAH box helicase family protein [Kiritimatiellia bacterium]